MSFSPQASSNLGHRGPTDHNVRDQIVAAAAEHFSHYGYGKTTVADLARAIGFSKAYIYKFFESKQAIGEAICGQCLAVISAAAANAAAPGPSAAERLRRYVRATIGTTSDLLFEDRKLYEIAAYSTQERWPTWLAHDQAMREILRRVLADGREAGEFERKTPLDELCRAIPQALQPFTNPVLLEQNLDLVPDGANEVISLILRSLAP